MEIFNVIDGNSFFRVLQKDFFHTPFIFLHFIFYFYHLFFIFSILRFFHYYLTLANIPLICSTDFYGFFFLFLFDENDFVNLSTEIVLSK